MKTPRPEPVPTPSKSPADASGPARSSVPGSIEFKQALLKRCFLKMTMGIVMLSPLVVSQLEHRWGQPGTGLMVELFLPIATVFFVVACVDYAKSKGLPPAMGLLGLGSIFGLMVLSFWPDRYKYDSEAKRERKKVGRN
jgi:hypothetical protein